MAKKKEKVDLFEKEIITDYSHAEKIYSSESKKYKFVLVCTILSLITTAITLIAFTPVAEWALFDWIDPVLEPLYLVGIVAALLTGPMKIIKVIFKVGKISWYIIPFFPLDVLCFLVGTALALASFVFLPAIYSGYNLYLSYLNKSAAEEYINGNANNNEVQTNYQNDNFQQPQTYKCPNCEAQVAYGEANCRNCGMAFRWN